MYFQSTPNLSSHNLDTSIDYSNFFSNPTSLPRISVNFANLPIKNPTVSPFKDINNSLLKKDINWIYSVGITTGKSPILYDPLAEVSRGEMATFLYRLAGSPSYTPPTTSILILTSIKIKFFGYPQLMLQTGLHHFTLQIQVLQEARWLHFYTGWQRL